MNKKYEELKKYEDIINENGSAIRKYKMQLESESKSSEEMMKIFYEMVLLTDLRCRKLREEQTGAGEKIISRDI